MNLRTPGPTPCPPEVLAAMARPMVDHRGPELAATLARVSAGLKRAFQTENDVLIFTTSGTGGLEAAVVNTISPGDKVLSVSCGVFGDRFASIAQTYGARVTKLAFEPGTAADPAAVSRALNADPEIRAVLITHNETSTGVTNLLTELAEAVRPSGALLMVDGISSVSSLSVPTDQLGLDVVVAGSQKGFMIPPGLAFLSLSARAWEAHARSTAPRFYFDAAKTREATAKGQTPWTPAVSLYFALDVGLQLLEAEGWANIYARHARVGAYTRSRLRQLGLELVAAEGVASNTVTAVRGPDGIDISTLRRRLREDYGVVLAGGQGSLTGKVFRIGHLGLVQEADIEEAVTALDKVLVSMGFRSPARV